MRSSSILAAALLTAGPPAVRAAAQEPSTPAPSAEAPAATSEGGSAPDSTPAAPPAALRRDLGDRGWSVGGWAGGAPKSYAGHFIGATEGRPIALLGVRFGSIRAQVGPVGVEYVAQLIPAAFVYDNPVEPRTTACAQVTTTGRTRQRRADYCRRRIFGAGAMPLGVQFNTPLRSGVQLFAAGSAGAFVFAQNMPVPQARRFNLAFDFGGGLELGHRRSGAVTLGYKLHHLSNAWTAQANPGVDHHVFYLGFIHRMHGSRGERRNPSPLASDGAASDSPAAPATPDSRPQY